MGVWPPDTHDRPHGLRPQGWPSPQDQGVHGAARRALQDIVSYQIGYLPYNPIPPDYIRRGRGPLADKLLGRPDQYNTPKTHDIGYYVYQTARTCLNRCLCVLCHHLVPDYAHPHRQIYHRGMPLGGLPSIFCRQSCTSIPKLQGPRLDFPRRAVLGAGVRQHNAAWVSAVGTVPSTVACNPCPILSRTAWH